MKIHCCRNCADHSAKTGLCGELSKRRDASSATLAEAMEATQVSALKNVRHGNVGTKVECFQTCSDRARQVEREATLSDADVKVS